MCNTAGIGSAAAEKMFTPWVAPAASDGNGVRTVKHS